MSTTQAITLTYTINDPPLKSDPPSIPANQTFTYPTSDSTSPSYSELYTATSAAVLQAQRDLNESLTAWKDAIGDAEKAKEDLGQVGYGKGKAARMMQYAAGREKEDVSVDADEEEDNEDDVEDAE